MSFPQYSDYKETRKDWLGAIPQHWTLKPLWTCFRRSKRTGFTDEELLSVYRDYGVIPKASRDDNFNKPSDDLGLYQLVEPGDLVINKMKAWQGSVAVSEYRGIVSPAYHVFEPTHCEDSRFLHYLMRSPQYITGYLSNSKGIRVNQWDLEPQRHTRMPLVLPPLEEQQAIAAFLDRETSKIDALVAEQRRLIELLQEKRQAVISHAVTKGLDPGVRMKPSGIEWLGDVPEHWEVVPMKRLMEIKDGTHATPSYVEPSDVSVPLITSKDFLDNEISFDDSKHISIEDHQEIIRRSNTESGDVLMSMIGGNIGKALIVETDRPFSIKNVALFKTTQNAELAKYLLYYLQSGLLSVQIDLLSRGGAQGFLGLGDIRNLTFFKIPIAELQDIVGELQRRVQTLSILMAEVECALELLQERRTALISAAVTGKIDVREAALQEMTS